MCVKRGHKRGTYKYIVNVNDGTTPLDLCRCRRSIHGSTAIEIRQRTRPGVSNEAKVPDSPPG